MLRENSPNDFVNENSRKTDFMSLCMSPRDMLPACTWSRLSFLKQLDDSEPVLYCLHWSV